jgi:hypothetical protein
VDGRPRVGEADTDPLLAALQREHGESDRKKSANEYDGADDFARSIDECYRAIRERKAKGGPGWGGPP